MCNVIDDFAIASSIPDIYILLSSPRTISGQNWVTDGFS